MPRLSCHLRPGATAIEVDGPLDIVGAYDLRLMIAEVIREGAPHIVLDLTRVSSVDLAGIECLSWCSEYALAAGRVITWAGCSQPLVSALESSLSSRKRGC